MSLIYIYHNVIIHGQQSTLTFNRSYFPRNICSFPSISPLPQHKFIFTHYDICFFIFIYNLDHIHHCCILQYFSSQSSPSLLLDDCLSLPHIYIFFWYNQTHEDCATSHCTNHYRQPPSVLSSISNKQARRVQYIYIRWVHNIEDDNLDALHFISVLMFLVSVSLSVYVTCISLIDWLIKWSFYHFSF